MVYIETTATLESFRRFLINNTCRSFIPESYLRDKEVFQKKRVNEEPYMWRQSRGKIGRLVVKP